jgi:hypothetical protein
MQTTKYLLLAAAVIGAALVGWLGRSHVESSAPQPANTRAQAPAEKAAGEAKVTPPANPTPGAIAPAATARASSWGLLLRQADDYWAFARTAHEAAVRGDGAAQWHLGLALNECDFTYKTYFLQSVPGGGTRYRTVDEAREHAIKNIVRPQFTTDEEFTILQKKCGRLVQASDRPFGTGEDWTEAAVASGYPLAQAAKAYTLALQGRYDRETEKAPARLAEARSLAMDALRTKDPDVFLQMAGVSEALTGRSDAEARKQGLSWTLVSCLRSPDCESLQETMRLRCKFDTQCQPYETPLDIIRRDAGNDFDEVERRARELNEKIDAGTLDETDI